MELKKGMEVLEEGHRYLLDNAYEGKKNIVVTFMKKVKNGEAEDLILSHDGTTNEAVFKMMIDRMEYLQAKLACEENAAVIVKLKESLAILEARTAAREELGIVGTDLSHEAPAEPTPVTPEENGTPAEDQGAVPNTPADPLPGSPDVPAEETPQ